MNNKLNIEYNVLLEFPIRRAAKSERQYKLHDITSMIPIFID